jgi:hypothetical protein
MYKLLDADGKEYLSEVPGTFGGNSKLTKTSHTPNGIRTFKIQYFS